MLLYLIRHGIAADKADPAYPSDPERPLTKEGIQKTREAARGLRALSIAPGAMLTSPYVRAVETAEIVAEALKFGVRKIRRTEALVPGANPAGLFEELADLRAEEVLCFGHAPHLDEVIAHALGLRSPVTSLRKAGAACLDLGTVSPPKGILEAVYEPKALRVMRR